MTVTTNSRRSHGIDGKRTFNPKGEQYTEVDSLVFGTLVLASAPASFAVAHEGHQMECNETGINAMQADIQSIDGEAKTTAMTEMKMAEEMMLKKDIEACATHMHSAMEAREK
jgi:hypothetical protein